MKQSRDFFWPSYVDLMTALFLTMLVLFVLSYKLFKDKEAQNQKLITNLQVQLKEKKKLDQIKEALKRLDGQYFSYDSTYRRYELNFPVQFDQWSADLPPDAQTPLTNAGTFLANQMKALDDNIQYLVVVEGRAAKDRKAPENAPVNQDRKEIRELSYNRAMAVIRQWRQAGVQIPPNVEVVAAGSGFKGLGRYTGDQEGLNRRFIIQIQPKIGSIGD